MRIISTTLVLAVLGGSSIASPAAAPAATDTVGGVVVGTVGITLAADGSFAKGTSSVPATVTRERIGRTVVITVVAQ